MQRWGMDEMRVETERKAIAREDRGKMTARFEKTIKSDWIKNVSAQKGSKL